MFLRNLGVISLIAIAVSLVLHYLLPQAEYIGETMASNGSTDPQTVYDFAAKDIDGNDVKLDKYRGSPLIIVNVASNCGFTKTNYKELNELYDKFADKGLKILAFPCNQFLNQEPACEVDIKEFAKKNNAQYDFFSKVDVNGNNQHPLWQWLKQKQGGLLGNFIKWNFTKFLINRDGIPVKRFGPSTAPSKMESDIVAIL